MTATTCINTDQCHYWPRHDDRCDRNTEPHSAMCSEHHDRDYETWWNTLDMLRNSGPEGIGLIPEYIRQQAAMGWI